MLGKGLNLMWSKNFIDNESTEKSCHPLCQNNLHSVFFPEWQILDTSKVRVCRQQFQIWRKWQKVLLTNRKYCGKRRNCFLSNFSFSNSIFFPQCFHMTSTVDLKKRGLFEKEIETNIWMLRLYFFFTFYTLVLITLDLRAEGDCILFSVWSLATLFYETLIIVKTWVFTAFLYKTQNFQTSLNWTHFKETKRNLAQKKDFLSKGIEKRCGKRRKMLVVSIFSSPTMISKAFTLYHIILTFNNPEEESFGKHCGKRRKWWCFLPNEREKSSL